MSLLSLLFGPPVPSLTAEELGEKIKGSGRILVVDVREPDEYRQGHISNSKLIPLNEIKKRMNELPKNREVVCVCASGSRSRMATKMLVDAGYNAFDMQGGMYMWQRAKLPVKRGA